MALPDKNKMGTRICRSNRSAPQPGRENALQRRGGNLLSSY